MIEINSLKNLDLLIELIPEIAFFKNVKGEYIYFNNSYLNFVQKTKKEG
jgi:hypothetical protein